MSSFASPAPEENFLMLWSGEDQILYQTLLERLTAAGIPCAHGPLGELAALPSDPLRFDAMPAFGFQVSVPASREEAAQTILEALLGEEPAPFLDSPAASDAPALDAPSPSPDQSTPTSQLWSTEDSEVAQFVIVALRENEIPVRSELVGSETTLFVPPALESRSREILHEVIEATPPQ